MSQQGRSAYDVLGVAVTATDEEIKKAYRALAMRHHPDRNNGSRESEERFKEISNAYDLVRDPSSRAAYDRSRWSVFGTSAGFDPFGLYRRPRRETADDPSRARRSGGAQQPHGQGTGPTGASGSQGSQQSRHSQHSQHAHQPPHANGAPGSRGSRDSRDADGSRRSRPSDDPFIQAAEELLEAMRRQGMTGFESFWNGTTQAEMQRELEREAARKRAAGQTGSATSASGAKPGPKPGPKSGAQTSAQWDTQSGAGAPSSASASSAGQRQSRAEQAYQAPRVGRDLYMEIQLTYALAIRGGRIAIVVPQSDGTDREVVVTLQPGVYEGQQILIPNVGMPGPVGGAPGNLYCVISLAPDPRYQRVGLGADLRATVDLPPGHAALGGSLFVPTVDGPVEVTIPAGSQPQDEIILEGYGLPQEGGTRGRLYLSVNILIPDGLDEEGRSLYENLHKWERRRYQRARTTNGGAGAQAGTTSRGATSGASPAGPDANAQEPGKTGTPQAERKSAGGGRSL